MRSVQKNSKNKGMVDAKSQILECGCRTCAGKPWGFMNERKENSEWRALCIGFLLGDLVGIALNAPMCSRNVFQRAVLGCVASRRYSPRNDGAVGDGGHRSMYSCLL